MESGNGIPKEMEVDKRQEFLNGMGKYVSLIGTINDTSIGRVI